MSPRDIGVIIKKVRLEIERVRGLLQENDDYDIESKSKITQAIKLFSEGRSPVDVVITLDLPADEVRAIYIESFGNSKGCINWPRYTKKRSMIFIIC